MNVAKVLAALLGIQPIAAEILLLLIKNGPMTAEEIARAANIDESTTRWMIWILRRRGLVDAQKIYTVRRVGRKPYKYRVPEEVKETIIEKCKELEKIIIIK